MGMFVLGLAVGCAACALAATVIFWALGLSIVGKKGRKKLAESKEDKNQTVLPKL